MTPDEYWHGGPEVTIAYREAEKLRKEEKNWEMWLQGYYIYNAICVALANFRGKNDQYLEKPIELFPHEETADEREERLEKEARQLERTLNAFSERFNGKRNSSIQLNNTTNQ